jgi:class 3 adenylate cyclase
MALDPLADDEFRDVWMAPDGAFFAPDLTSQYRRYVPKFIVERLLAHGRPAGVSREQFRSAVLFADLSGFTRMTEAFAQEGPSGAESLTRVLNDYFGRLISIIEEDGGDIVKFAGDAVMVLWTTPDEDDEDNESLRQATLRATHCALRMQREVAGYQYGGHELAMRVSVAAGEVAVLHVGGEFGRWEFTLAGEPLNRVGAASDITQPGEVVAGPQAWALLKDLAVAGRSHESGVHIPALVEHPEPLARKSVAISTEFEEPLRGYLPAAIVRRIIAGQTDYLGEVRYLTIIFVNLPDINYQTPLEVGQAAMRGLQRALYVPFEGSINKISVDDKGVMVIGALGLTPFAHEDDPARGALAGLAMHAALAELGLRSSIGVTTGRVYCGSIGSTVRMEYTIMGYKVNMAARLMQKAGDGVLCDAETHDRSSDAVLYDGGERFSLKGQSESVIAYRPLAAVRAAGMKERVDKFIGRDSELARMHAVLQELLDHGKNQVVVVEGDAGIGKTHLLYGFMQQIADQPVRVIAGAGDAIERTTSYLAWHHVLLDLLNLEAIPAPERGEHLQAALERDKAAQELLPLLNPVLHLDLPDNDLTRAMTGEVRSRNLCKLVIRLLAFSAARKAVVLVFDDAHCMDPASWALLNSVIAGVVPMMVVLMTRAEVDRNTAADDIVELSHRADSTQLHLGRMTPDETVQIVADELGANDLPEAAANLIRERAQGHPFFAEELGLSLHAEGLIAVTDGVCCVVDADALAHCVLPSSIEAVITSRVDRQPPDELITLKVASVIGREFTLAELAAVHPVIREWDKLRAILASLQQDIERLDGIAEPTYQFRHAITQTVAYELMLESQRQALHLEVANWIEATHRVELQFHYATLAHHWGAAGDSTKAVDYLEKAAAETLNTNACDPALR